jgi:hypothetical protein
MKTIGVTHGQFDFDGGSCLKVLQKLGMIEGCIFGDEELKMALAGELSERLGGFDKLIFADASPKEPIDGSQFEVLVYDHHQTENSQGADETAFDILLNAVGTAGLDLEKLARWKQLVYSGDHNKEPDNMDVINSLKKVAELYKNDQTAYDYWFSPLFDSFFANTPNFNRGLQILQEEIVDFLKLNPDSPAKEFMLKWHKRAGDVQNISSKKLYRNLVHWLAYFEEKQAREWLKILLSAYDNEQKDFQECLADFHKAKVAYYGNTLIISAISKSKIFLKVARSVITSRDQDKNQLIREKVRNKDSLWVVVIVNPANKNFQIFINGNKTQCHETIAEVAKAVRAEILTRRGLSVPSVEILLQDGVLEDTRPIYFHKLESGYPSLLWGSLKHQAPPAIEFGDTSFQIHAKLIELIKLALDENEFAADCNPRSCEKCSIFSWQLKKCQNKRANVK